MSTDTNTMTTPLERVAQLRIAIAALEARIQKTPPGPEVRKNADEWQTIYLELVALERSLNIPDYDDRLMAEPITEEEKKWIENYEKEEDENYENEEED
jgi:aspartyl/asparaginyl beta-hydroxylase (cupin superfamily)